MTSAPLRVLPGRLPPRAPRSRPGPSARRTWLATALILVVALPGTACAGVNALGLLLAQPAVAVLALVLATTTTLPYSAAILWLDRHEQEPAWLLAAGFTWGALAATGVALVLNTLAQAVGAAVLGAPDQAALLTAWFWAPLVEEPLKATALVVLFSLYRHHLDGVLDGIVYGAIVGMGFAWFENVLYYANAAADGTVAMVSLAWVRGVLSGVGSHATFTALTGIGFGLARVVRRGPLRPILPTIGLAAAIGAHGTWNIATSIVLSVWGASAPALAVPTAIVLLQLPFVTTVGLVAMLAWRHEDAMIRRYLGAEAPTVASPDDVAQLVPARRRAQQAWRALAGGGVAAWWRHRQLTQALIRLAFERWHHEQDRVPWPVDEDAHILVLRARIAALRTGAGPPRDADHRP